MALQKINTDLISANTIATSNIADNSVDATKIAQNSILTRHIDDNQVTGDHIADNAILTQHIDDDQVTGDQLADAITVVTSVTSPLLVASTAARVTQVAITSSSNAVAWDAAAAANAYHVQLRIQHSLHQVMLLKEQSYKQNQHRAEQQEQQRGIQSLNLRQVQHQL